MHYDFCPLGHEKLDTTARYTRVATKSISELQQPAQTAPRASKEEDRAGGLKRAADMSRQQRWRSWTFSATTAPLGVRPTAGT